MKKIELTQGKVTQVDDEDYGWLNQWKWYAIKHRNTFYATRHRKIINDKKRSLVRIHRLIINAPKGIDVDHFDTDGLNNQRCNIRLCTNQQNCMNRKPQKNATSIYKGVVWRKDHDIWAAQIGFNRKNIHLGYFDFESKAAFAYNKAAIELFGEFARLNIIEEQYG